MPMIAKFLVQTRDSHGAISEFETLGNALAYAKGNRDVYKISFSLPTGERVRLMFDGASWLYEPILLPKPAA